MVWAVEDMRGDCQPVSGCFKDQSGEEEGTTETMQIISNSCMLLIEASSLHSSGYYLCCLSLPKRLHFKTFYPSNWCLVQYQGNHCQFIIIEKLHTITDNAPYLHANVYVLGEAGANVFSVLAGFAADHTVLPLSFIHILIMKNSI